MKHFFVYIIYSSSHNIYYIGQTNDLDDRLIRHNSNRSKFTKGKGPWELTSSIKLNSRSEAIKLERKLKNMKNSKKAIEYLNKLAQSIPTKSGGS
jgi:putative endonuclease